ncbi:TIGR03619 family F420-dependent LLM class oxidoreductase [Myxococcota bacterium]|nr:TIGR03619 family F420-dependent LLM class oxidoreductase [Myxococcota bacterium]
MGIKIGLGLAGLPFEDAGGYWRWVESCEADPHVDSIWHSDQLVTRDPTLESISAMAALAGATSRLKFGMSVTVVSHRDPLVLAKQCATIDYLSGGRLLPAFGVGPSAAPEWRATGRSPAGRGRKSDEALTLLARLWSEESVTFEGEFYRYTDASISPRPVQDPLPLWIGGNSDAAVRRTARIGTGWVAGISSPSQVETVVRAIAKASAEVGRPVPADHYGAGFSFRFGSWDDPLVERMARNLARFQPDFDPKGYLAVGTAADIRARIEEYAKVGITKFILRPMATGERETLDQTQRVIEEVLPAF